MLKRSALVFSYESIFQIKSQSLDGAKYVPSIRREKVGKSFSRVRPSRLHTRTYELADKQAAHGSVHLS